MRILNPTISGSLIVSGSTIITGVVSASFFSGDGSGLTGVTSYTNTDTLNYINSIGVISGSQQIATQISGAFASVSASIALDIENIYTDIRYTLPTANDSSISSTLDAWNAFKPYLDKSVEAGRLFTTDITSTYSLVYTTSLAYAGGVLAPNGDIHFVPYSANRGQKVSPNGTVSTYSMVYTTFDAYIGGVLAPNGDIHFVPFSADRGQKIIRNSANNFSNVIAMHSFFNKL